MKLIVNRILLLALLIIMILIIIIIIITIIIIIIIIIITFIKLLFIAGKLRNPKSTKPLLPIIESRKFQLKRWGLASVQTDP